MDINERQIEFINSLEGEFTPAAAAQLLELGMEGDTSVPALETGSAPNATTAGENTPPGESGEQHNNGAAGAVPNESELNAENAVILAKDGKHTIKFDVLADSRREAQQLKTRMAAMQGELDSLRAQAEARAAAGEKPTAIDNQIAAVQTAIDLGVDLAIFGDYSEEALAKGIQTLVAQHVAAEVSAAVSQKLAPLEEQKALDATKAHYQAIYDAHPDADSIAESQELANWIAQQPTFARQAYEKVLEAGSSAEVVELFTTFKEAAGAPSDAVQRNVVRDKDVKTAAKEVIAGAAPVIPTSLTDFPGGNVGQSRDDQVAAKTGAALLEAMSSWTPEQTEAYLNRRL